jgi:hypothetical protein
MARKLGLRLQGLTSVQAPAPELPAHRQATGVQVASAQLGEDLVGWRCLADGMITPAALCPIIRDYHDGAIELSHTYRWNYRSGTNCWAKPSGGKSNWLSLPWNRMREIAVAAGNRHC